MTKMPSQTDDFSHTSRFFWLLYTYCLRNLAIMTKVGRAKPPGASKGTRRREQDPDASKPPGTSKGTRRCEQRPRRAKPPGASKGTRRRGQKAAPSKTRAPSKVRPPAHMTQRKRAMHEASPFPVGLTIYRVCSWACARLCAGAACLKVPRVISSCDPQRAE